MLSGDFYQREEFEGLDYWDQHPTYNRAMWALEVSRNSTLMGYWDWVLEQIKIDENLPVYRYFYVITEPVNDGGLSVVDCGEVDWFGLIKTARNLPVERHLTYDRVEVKAGE